MPVEITNADLRAKGVRTGDGAQWFRALAVAPSAPDFMLWCTDVGGLFRSLDGGANWEPTNVGFHSRGSSGVAIDPRNADRAIVIAANSVVSRFNGIYLSTDRAASWRQVLSLQMAASPDRGRVQVVFDPSSFDAKAGFTRVAYWSRLEVDRAMWGTPEQHPALYRTDDGGETWEEVPGGAIAAGAILVIHPTNGTLYAANRHGVMLSRDGGRTWTTTMEGAATGISLSPAAPEIVWASQADAVFRSDDGGLTWTRNDAADTITAERGSLRNITAAPSDPTRLVIYRHNPGYHFPRFYSHDGGATWHEAEVVRGFTLIPSNNREGHFSFHPTNADIILAPGGDYPALSRDGGRTYAWAGNGVNNILIGNSFSFSTIDPDVAFFGSQDYAAVLTTDGGRNWRYFAPGGKSWGGFNYGAYASTPDTLLVGESLSWGGPKMLNISTDGGASWTITDKRMAPSPHIAYGAPGAPDILFASPFRSMDRGRSWSEMTGATHVFTHRPDSGQLWGIRRATDRGAPDVVVCSDDKGATWRDVFTASGTVADLAVDAARARVWVVDQNRLRVWAGGEFLPDPELPRDQQGYPRIRSVATDPVDPSVVYAASNRDAFATNVAALRSRDGGATWENLTLNEPLDGTRLDGGREAHWVRVHPRTREPWFLTGCYGIWKYSAP
jgi:photosystem II stability/assembly factor-like uncharacterized protein